MPLFSRRKSFFKFLCSLFLLHSASALAQVPADYYLDTDTIKARREHVPGGGFKLLEKKDGALIFSIYASTRYLNQKGLDNSYTDSFGRTFTVKQRNDFQFQKVMLYFKGWLFDRRFRYMTYVWTSNTSQGLGAQVVVAGNFQYLINKYLDLGVGIGGLPTNRSLIGQFPSWLRHDARTMSEEFFRASYTSGIWLQGDLGKGFNYKTMIGNNMSQLGIDAGQLDNDFDAWSSTLWWVSEGYGRFMDYGDFARKNTLRGALGACYSQSSESAQSQAGSEAPENSQIRLSDGTNLFGINAFNTGANITAARYQMTSFMGGLKYKGFSLDADFFLREISDLSSTGPIPVSKLEDTGFDLQASAMLVDSTLQAYGTYAQIDGEYGDPSEICLGLNWFPYKNRSLRLNAEVILADKSPIGSLAHPVVVGSNGTAFMINIELFY